MTVLPTAIIRIRCKDGIFHQARALIDSGSGASLVSEACMPRLWITRSNDRFAVTGEAGSQAGTTRGAAQLEIASRFNDEIVLKTQAYILEVLAPSTPCQSFTPKRMKPLAGLQLADPGFNLPDQVDVILGVELFLPILQAGSLGAALYINFMTESRRLRHMELVPQTEVDKHPSECFYMPHLAVRWVDSLTMILRVVFHGFSRASSGVSMNDRLQIGPDTRPLFAMSNFPDSCEAIPPGHIIQQPLNLRPEPSVPDVSRNSLDNWQMVQQKVANIWTCWCNEYVTSFRPRSKWKPEINNPDAVQRDNGVPEADTEAGTATG